MMDLRILRLNYNPPNILELGYGEMFERIEEITFVSSLMQTFERFMLVCDVKWSDAPDPPFLERVLLIESAQEISTVGNRSFMLVSGQFPDAYRKMIKEFFETFKCFIEFPASFRRETMTGSIVGTQENLNMFLEFARTWGATFEILSIKRYEPRVEKALSGLTKRQYAVLETAYLNGYFDLPKRCDSRELGQKMGMAHTTFLEHLKKAERTVLEDLFKR